MSGGFVASNDRPGHTRLGDTLSSRSVTLHAAWIGGRAAAISVARRGREPAFRPVRADLDDMTALFQFIDRRFRHAILDHQHARASVRGQNEIGKCSECQAGASIASCRFILPWTWRGRIAPSIGPADRRRANPRRDKVRHRAAPWSATGWCADVCRARANSDASPRARNAVASAEAKAEFGDDAERLQPAARRRRRHHIAGLVDDIEMHSVAAHFAEPPDGRLAGTERADRGALSVPRAAISPPRRNWRPSRAAIPARLCR